MMKLRYRVLQSSVSRTSLGNSLFLPAMNRWAIISSPLARTALQAFFVQSRAEALSNIGNPKSLIMNLNALQPARRQFFLSQSEKGEVWQIAQNGLKPTVKRQNLSHSLVQKLVCVECQHGNVLRSSRRGN